MTGARLPSMSWAIAVLLAGLSLAGLCCDAVYAREAPAWVAQAIGQDWFDLLIAAPWIAVCGIGARHSRRWRILLAGAYAYTVYELAIYAFAVHFNALFLIYCATLGLAGFALVWIIIELAPHAPRIDRRSARIAGGFLVGVGLVFAALWLAEDIPAVLRNTAPRSLQEAGLFTNPVHVIDLAFVLPAHVIAGVIVWRTRAALFAQIVLAFGVLMAASIGGMLVTIGGGPIAAAMFAIAFASAAILARTFTSRMHFAA
jgi:hypothetical protein